jgi:hypothetical protein
LFKELLAQIAAQRPLAIGLDILMPEPDNTSPEALAARMPEGRLHDELTQLPSHDALLAEQCGARRLCLVRRASCTRRPAPATPCACGRCVRAGRMRHICR